MNRKDKIKLAFSRNWKFPGQKRLLNFLKPSTELKRNLENGITWLDDEPVAIYTSADNFIECSILIEGNYEREINRIFSISLKEGDIAIDIGANIGLHSLRMAGYTGKTGYVLCYEPLEYLQRKILKNIQLNSFSNIHLFPFALSDKDADKVFPMDEKIWNQGNFSIGPNEQGTQSQLVKIKIADHLPEINQLNSLQLIKIDVEGFELNVLKGLKNTISKFRPRIIFEYNEYHWKENNQSISDCYNFLKEYNYSLYQIYVAGCELISDQNPIKSGNIFCIPETL